MKNVNTLFILFTRSFLLKYCANRWGTKYDLESFFSSDNSACWKKLYPFLGSTLFYFIAYLRQTHLGFMISLITAQNNYLLNFRGVCFSKRCYCSKSMNWALKEMPYKMVQRFTAEFVNSVEDDFSKRDENNYDATEQFWHAAVSSAWKRKKNTINTHSCLIHASTTPRRHIFSSKSC